MMKKAMRKRLALKLETVRMLLMELSQAELQRVRGGDEKIRPPSTTKTDE